MSTTTPCHLCSRAGPQLVLERHHLKTRREDKDLIELVCRECHKQIHALFPQRDLRNVALNLDSVEGLLANEKFLAARKFIQKIKPGETIRSRESKRKRGW